MIQSQILRQADFKSEWYKRWRPILALDAPKRKTWEWAAIAHALDERGLLESGKAGLGFGVGKEPLAAAFASRGVKIVATDQSRDARNAIPHWEETGQLGQSFQDMLSRPGLKYDEAKVRENLSFEICDMRNVPKAYHGQFDFNYSASSLDHLGSHTEAFNFLNASLECLKPGGCSIHTTEFSLSKYHTVYEDNTVFFREQDLEAYFDFVRKRGYEPTALDLTRGTHPYDLQPHFEPYTDPLATVIEAGSCIITSVLLIIQKP